jgi:glycosyltransferase involved in cell wall biosynthesis
MPAKLRKQTLSHETSPAVGQNRPMQRTLRPRCLLIVTDSLYAGLGGVVAGQVEWFRGQGWQVAVAARIDDRNISLPVPIRDIAMPFGVRSVQALLKSANKLRRELNSLKPDVIHCHGLRSLAVCQLAGRRAFIHLHGTGELPSDPPLYNLIRKLVLKSAAFVSLGAMSASPEMGARWSFQPDVSPRLRELALQPFPSEGIPTFLWMGRLSEQKRPELFVEAMARVGADIPVRGLIAGTGPLLEAARDLAVTLKSPVEFLGHRDDIPELLQRSWAMVLLTRFEGMPLAVQEAMWVGRPVIGSRIAPLQWLVGDDDLLADDIDGVSKAISLLSNHAEALTRGRSAAQRVRKLLSPESPWPEVERIYGQRSRHSRHRRSGR